MKSDDMSAINNIFASDTAAATNDKNNSKSDERDIFSEDKDSDVIDDDNITYWDLPSNVSSIILNIGSHKDPIVPGPNNDECGLSIAVEPIVHSEIEAHPQLHVIPAAISPTTGISTMHVYGDNGGVSSSLAKSIQFASSDNVGKSNIRLVPTITMNQLLSSVPPHIPINYMMTDMQGYDHAAVKSGMKEIIRRQIPVIVTEVTIGGLCTYEGVNNDLCYHWIPMMAQHGYYLDKVTRHSLKNIWFRNAKDAQAKICQKQSAAKVKYGFNEGNAVWRLMNSTIAKKMPYIYPTVSEEKARYETMDVTLHNVTLPVKCF